MNVLTCPLRQSSPSEQPIAETLSSSPSPVDSANDRKLPMPLPLLRQPVAFRPAAITRALTSTRPIRDFEIVRQLRAHLGQLEDLISRLAFKMREISDETPLPDARGPSRHRDRLYIATIHRIQDRFQGDTSKRS